MGRVLKLVLVILICIPVFGWFGESLERTYLAHRYPVPGQFVLVNDRNVHLDCVGSGTPTVVFESGLGEGWLEWVRVQPEIAKVTRACSYDRPGVAWSAPQSGPRDAVHIADQLHLLLQNAGEHPPYVLVGASAGGFYVRQFVSAYPAEVSGVVFADSSVPSQVHDLPGAGYSLDGYSATKNAAWRAWFSELTGWARISGQCNGDPLTPAEFRGFARSEACIPTAELRFVDDWKGFWPSAVQAEQSNCCGDRPLLVISQDPDRDHTGWSAQAIANQPIWNRMQESLKDLSSHSRRVIARGSPHHVAMTRPDVVIDAIKEVVSAARSGDVHNFDHNTTAQ